MFRQRLALWVVVQQGVSDPTLSFKRQDSKTGLSPGLRFEAPRGTDRSDKLYSRGIIFYP
jgi:hypothetical protein